MPPVRPSLAGIFGKGAEVSDSVNKEQSAEENKKAKSDSIC
jgi:hypothetical protein